MKTNKFFSKKYVLNVLFLLCFTFTFTFFTHVNAKAATAPGQVTGLVQTSKFGNDNCVSIQWNNLGPNVWYKIMYATNVNGSYQTSETASQTETWINGLSAGSTYYVKVQALIEDENGQDIYGPESAPIEVVTEPSTKPTNVHQSSSTPNSVTVSWNPVNGANNYRIEYAKDESGSTTKEVNTANTSITVSDISPNSEYIFKVYAERKNTNFNAADGTYDYCYGKTTPSKIAGVSIQYYWNSLNAVQLQWTKNAVPDGYQIQLNLDKKTIKTYNITGSYPGVELKKITQNKFFKTRVRGYITVNGQKVYGDYSDWFYFSQQPKVSLQSNPNGMNVGWVKVTGASDYTVYASTKKNSGYKKVGTTKNTNMLVKKIGKTKLKSGKTYYFYAVANKKAGSTTYTGKATYCWSLKYRK